MSVQSGGRQILIHGMALVLVELVRGIVVLLVPYSRLALGSHILAALGLIVSWTLLIFGFERRPPATVSAD